MSDVHNERPSVPESDLGATSEQTKSREDIEKLKQRIQDLVEGPLEIARKGLLDALESPDNIINISGNLGTYFEHVLKYIFMEAARTRQELEDEANEGEPPKKSARVDNG